MSLERIANKLAEAGGMIDPAIWTIKRFAKAIGASTRGRGAIGLRRAAIVTDEVWKQYIEDQKPEQSDDNFKVV